LQDLARTRHPSSFSLADHASDGVAPIVEESGGTDDAAVRPSLTRRCDFHAPRRPVGPLAPWGCLMYTPLSHAQLRATAKPNLRGPGFSTLAGNLLLGVQPPGLHPEREGRRSTRTRIAWRPQTSSQGGRVRLRGQYRPSWYPPPKMLLRVSAPQPKTMHRFTTSRVAGTALVPMPLPERIERRERIYAGSSPARRITHWCSSAHCSYTVSHRFHYAPLS